MGERLSEQEERTILIDISALPSQTVRHIQTSLEDFGKVLGLSVRTAVTDGELEVTFDARAESKITAKLQRMGYEFVTLESEEAFRKAMAELTADRDYHALTPRERNFIENFLSAVIGDRFADGENFQADLRSYRYKNVTRLLSLYNRHYPRFVAAMRATPTEEVWKPPKVYEGISAILGDLETLLEGLLDQLG
jgi:hypothetical protein